MSCALSGRVADFLRCLRFVEGSRDRRPKWLASEPRRLCSYLLVCDRTKPAKRGEDIGLVKESGQWWGGEERGGEERGGRGGRGGEGKGRREGRGGEEGGEGGEGGGEGRGGRRAGGEAGERGGEGGARTEGTHS